MFLEKKEKEANKEQKKKCMFSKRHQIKSGSVKSELLHKFTGLLINIAFD